MYIIFSGNFVLTSASPRAEKLRADVESQLPVERVQVIWECAPGLNIQMLVAADVQST